MDSQHLALLHKITDVFHQVAKLLPCFQPAAHAKFHAQIRAVSSQFKCTLKAIAVVNEARYSHDTGSWRIIRVKRHLYTGFLTYRECPVQKIFEIIPDFFFRINPSMARLPLCDLLHVYDPADRTAGMFSYPLVGTHCTVRLPCQGADRNLTLSHNRSKLVIARNLLVPAFQSQMNDRVFKHGKASCIRNLQIKLCHALLQAGHTLIIPVVFVKHDRDILHAHLPVKLKFCIAGS